MPSSFNQFGHSVPAWKVVGEARHAQPEAPKRRRGPRVLVIGSVVAVLSIALTAISSLLFSFGTASAVAGQPDRLREGCSWDSSAYYVQNCQVWSPSQNKFVMVQIRASEGSNQGVYLLDGMRAREDRSAWTTDVKAAQVYDRTTDTTLVMPVGGASSFYTDWDAGAGDKNATIKQETFLTSELPAYLAQNFGVSPSNNAIIGLSMSAGPAVTLAERHPEQFKVVQAMSGYYQTDNPVGALGVFASQTLVSNYTNGILNMWGAPGSNRWTENDPSKNVSKLKDNGQVLIISSGNGFLTPGELAKLAPQDQISAIALEMLSAVSTILMQIQAAQSGANVVVLPNYGGHTWENWGRALRDGRDEVTEALRNAPPVTAKMQVVDAGGSEVPGGAAKATNAALVVAEEPAVLPADVTASTESSAAPSDPESATTTQPPVSVTSTESPAGDASTEPTPTATDTSATSTPSTSTTTTTPTTSSAR
ncbi:S-formylglutathione hydrolase FrmB [Williamsia limnetica]|uniref:S-formylglutathione hydrolase FrmB n=1 Tax=Williamsia limnetica TaxID=882452 RepID=A0A318RIM6_WILLI|nr:alpha/beta hydrolase family protein [Williamsia limnetica]PYE17401.1 S-formylglutathione hydrolase FrmB [Williamsia limnetica]